MADCSPYVTQLRQAERLLKDLFNVLAAKPVAQMSKAERELLDSCEFYFSGLEDLPHPPPPPPGPPPPDDRWDWE